MPSSNPRAKLAEIDKRLNRGRPHGSQTLSTTSRNGRSWHQPTSKPITA
jgi:hypothetical protein